MELYCKDEIINTPTNTPIPPSNTPTNTPIPLNTFNHKFTHDSLNDDYYCKDEIKSCSSYGMEYFAFTNNLGGGANYPLKGSSTCVKESECITTNGNACESNSSGQTRYLFCEEIVQITDTPTATSTPIVTAIATPTATPIGTPANTPTITPTPDNSIAVKCGPMDSYNIAGESDGDGLITGNDFTAFANKYGKTCNDDNVDYGKCGGKNRILYDGDHKVDVHDLVYFAVVFNEKSCDINDLYVLPQTGGEVKIDSINYTVIVLLELLATIVMLFGLYNLKLHKNSEFKQTDKEK